MGVFLVEPNEDTVWFYIKDEQQLGPAGMFELSKLFEQGVLNENSYLWTKSADCWQKAKALEPFNHFKPKSPHQHSAQNLSQIAGSPDMVTFPKGRPLVRFIARMFDLSVFTAFFLTLVSIFSPKAILTTSKLSLFVIIVLLWLFVEPMVVTIFGNTLGKALLHTKIKSANGEYIDFITIFKRSIYVITAGMGLGVPIINFICWLFSYKDLKEHGISTWDKKSDTVILYSNVNRSRIVLIACFPVILFMAGVFLSLR